MAANALAQATSITGGNAVASVNRTFGSSCTNGSLLVGLGWWGTTLGDNYQYSDPTNGTWTKHLSLEFDTGTRQGGVGIWSVANTATSALTVTFSKITSTSNLEMVAFELTNAGGTPAFDSSGQNSSTAGAAVSVSDTLAAANCTVFFAMAHYNNGAAADTNYTSSGVLNVVRGNTFDSGEYRVDAGSAGGITLTFGGVTPNAGYAGIIVAFAPPGGSSAVTPWPFQRGLRVLDRLRNTLTMRELAAA